MKKESNFYSYLWMKGSHILNNSKSRIMYFKCVFQKIIIIYICPLEEILDIINILTLKSRHKNRFIVTYPS